MTIVESTLRVLGIGPGVGGGMAIVELVEDSSSTTFEVVAAVRGDSYHNVDAFGCLGVGSEKIVSPRAVRDFWVESDDLDVDFHATDSDDSFVGIDDYCVIERQQDRDNQAGGVQMMFNYGRLSLSCERIFMEGHVFYASPLEWKPEMGLTRDKGRSIAKATELFGAEAAAEFWPRAEDDGVAEACLLARWRMVKIMQAKAYERGGVFSLLSSALGQGSR